jgi:uncharacterized protein (TIGR02391 family)
MAKRTSPSSPQSAQLTPQQIRAAIPKLERRVAEWNALNVEALTEEDHDDKVEDLKRRSHATLDEVFGHDSIDYKRYRIETIDGTPLFIGRYPRIEERRPYIRKGIASAISKLESAITVLNERLEDSGETAAARALNAYQGLDLHPEIAKAASQLYSDGHYSHAVEDSVKALSALVRSLSGLALDGVALMQQAFSPKSPILKFNDLLTQSDRDEQQGFMNIFWGAVSALRNPRAHGFISDDPERALEFVAFVSLLAKLLDEAKKA